MTPPPATVFRHAAASFDPTDEAVLLWTRLTGTTEADWVVARDPELQDVVASGTATTGAARDFTLTVDATGLSPATTYWYGFTSNGERSPVGRTRTLPRGAVDRVLLGAVCCAQFTAAPLTVYRALAAREVDLVVHLGDYVYDEGTDKGLRQHRPEGPTLDLGDYRERLAQIREDEDCQALHLRHPVVAMWDDHDFADNAWCGGAKTHDESEHGPWAARARAAAQARQEWLPARLPNPDEPLHTWRSVILGDLAELVLLDTRLTGRDLQSGDPDALPVDDPDRSLLGDAQRRWLAERLADVTRPWSVVASGVVVNPMPLHVPAASLLGAVLPEGYAVHDGKVIRADQWDGYTVERDRLIAEIAERRSAGAATLLLSGDVHSSWAFEGPVDESDRAVAVEVTVPSVSSVPMGHSRLPGMYRLLDAAADRLDHVRWADVVQRGFVVLELTAEAATAAWWFVDAYETGEPQPELGQSLRTSRAAVVPAWADAEAPDDGPLASPESLPPRPDDLPALRRHEFRRRTVRVALPAAVALVAAAGSGTRWRRGRS